MIAIRNNLEVDYLVDKITHNGFNIEREDKYAPINIDQLVNSSKYLDNEYRCDCGAFIGQDIVGQQCPRCKSEIALHSLNFGYTGWVNIAPHVIISPVYYSLLKRVLTDKFLNFILGNYKEDLNVQYDEEDTSFEENKAKKKTGRPAQNDIKTMINTIPKSKHQYQGIGHNGFFERFEEILTNCVSKQFVSEVELLIDNKYSVFTSKIPIYSTAFRPQSKTAESMFYPRINKWFSKIVAIACKLEDMTYEKEIIFSLNHIQTDLLRACDDLIKMEMSKKEGFVRAEIVGGTFSFSTRAVITLDISLNGDELDAPYPMCLEAFKYAITHKLATRYNMTLERALLFVQNNDRNEIVIQLLDEIMAQNRWIFLLREPTINLGSIAKMRIRKYKFNDDTISLPLEVLTGFNADFDGDALNGAFLPKEIEASFNAFHHSYMTNYVTEEIEVEWKEWADIALWNMGR
jgi:hypothetical protein